MRRNSFIVGTVVLLILAGLVMASCSSNTTESSAGTTLASTGTTQSVSAGTNPNPGETVKWVLATSSGSGANIWMFNPYPRYQEAIETATDGALTFDTKVDLVPANAALEAVIAGQADACFQRSTFVSGTFPLLDIGSLPFFFGDPYEYEKFINDPRTVAIWDEYLDGLGLVRIMEVPDGYLDVIFSNKKIATIDDFKGLKIRASGMVTTYTLQQLGASAMTIAVTEIADTVSRGTVDAVLSSAPFGLGLGMQDVTTQVSYWPIQSAFGGVLVANKNSWAKLSPWAQERIRETSREIQGQVVFGGDIEQTLGKMGLVAAGLEVTQPTKEELEKARQACKPAIQEWVKAAGPKGQELLDIAAEYASGAASMLK